MCLCEGKVYVIRLSSYDPGTCKPLAPCEVDHRTIELPPPPGLGPEQCTTMTVGWLSLTWDACCGREEYAEACVSRRVLGPRLIGRLRKAMRTIEPASEPGVCPRHGAPPAAASPVHATSGGNAGEREGPGPPAAATISALSSPPPPAQPTCSAPQARIGLPQQLSRPGPAGHRYQRIPLGARLVMRPLARARLRTYCSYGQRAKGDEPPATPATGSVQQGLCGGWVAHDRWDGGSGRQKSDLLMNKGHSKEKRRKPKIREPNSRDAMRVRERTALRPFKKQALDGTNQFR